jgi:hypothetical protein
VINLRDLEENLKDVEAEAEAYGLSKSLRDRIAAARMVLPVIEAARERQFGPVAA